MLENWSEQAWEFRILSFCNKNLSDKSIQVKQNRLSSDQDINIENTLLKFECSTLFLCNKTLNLHRSDTI